MKNILHVAPITQRVHQHLDLDIQCIRIFENLSEMKPCCLANVTDPGIKRTGCHMTKLGGEMANWYNLHWEKSSLNFGETTSWIFCIDYQQRQWVSVLSLTILVYNGLYMSVYTVYLYFHMNKNICESHNQVNPNGTIIT